MDQLGLVARLGVALSRGRMAHADAPGDSGNHAAAAARPGEVSQPPALIHQHDAVRRFSIARRLAGTSCPPDAPVLHAHLCALSTRCRRSHTRPARAVRTLTSLLSVAW
jgi:hypothetical protein